MNTMYRILVTSLYWIIIAAFIAVCGAAKLDRTYLPPASAKTAGGSPGALQTPNSFSQNEAPKGSYTNEFQGVVVDAALAGTRASGSEVSGLGGPRNSYGSTASKVGDAAFRGSQAGFRFPVSAQEAEPNSLFEDSRPELSQANQFGNTRDTPEGHKSFGAPRDSIPERSEPFGVARDSRPERPQAAQERTASTLRFDSEVGVESFNYAFETDNGISAEESGTATNGVQAQGGYSYTGDDGKVYTVTYTADEGGYQPRGDHLPTPPPIPEEILKSLEQNARDEANGVVDDGLYDAQKYNAGDDYAESDIVSAKPNGRPSVNTGNSDVDTSGSFISQNNLPFNPNNQRQRNEDRAPVNRLQTASNGNRNGNRNGNFQSNSATSNRFGSRNEYLPPFSNQNRQNSRPQASGNVNAPDADSSSTFQQETTEGSGDFHSDSHDNQAPIRPAAPAFPRPTNQNQIDGFKQTSTSTNFNHNANRFPSSQGSRQQFGSQGSRNQFSAKPSSPSFNSLHSTSIPDTELTTPFESTSNQDGSQPSAPAATNAFGFNAQSRPGQPQFGFQNTQREPTKAPARPTIPSFTQSRPQNSNNRPLHGNVHSQSAFSSQASQVQQQFNQQSQFGNKRPQFSQNQFSQNSEPSFASSTQKPQFAQQSNTQDDSYYYNQPSRAFNTPKIQGSRFPSSPSHQFDRVTQQPSFSSQTTQYSEEENYPSTPFPSQNGQRHGTTRYPRPSAAPTESTPTDNQFQSNAIASATNGITQASASSFAAPTSATGFNRQQFSQSRQQFQQSSFQSNRPSSPQPIKPFVAQTTVQPQSNQGQHFEQHSSEPAQPLSQQALQDIKQPKLDDDETPSDTPVINAQYDGELYEYNKPADLPPPPKNGFGQFGTKVQSSRPTQSRPEISQSTIAETQQPTSGPSFASTPSRFGQPAKSSQDQQFEPRPQFSQTSVTQPEKPAFGSFGSKPMRFGQTATAPQGDQFGAQTTQEQSTNDRFNMKPSRHQFGQAKDREVNNQFQSQTNQRRPFSSQGSFGSSAVENSRPFGQSCCNSGKFGQAQSFGQGRPSQFGGESQFGQGSSGLRPDESQLVAGRGEVFGGPRKPPSFDENGYHY